MKAKLLLILLAVAIATGSMTACKKKGAAADCSCVLRTTAYRGSASSRRAHPAKAGAAKPRVLASPHATHPTFRGTPKIAELLWLARRLQ